MTKYTMGITLTLALGLAACYYAGGAGEKSMRTDGKPAPTTAPAAADVLARAQTADFAAGCFWGSEATFRKVPGVISTQVGFEGGTTDSPTYKDVCTDQTGHAETVQVTFDPRVVSYKQLVDVFFENHDPTTVDRQGPDAGTQYRSVIFYHSPEQQKIAETVKAERNKSGDYVDPIVTAITPAGKFFRAEEYHQEYFDKQGVEYTCHNGNGKKPGR